MWMYIALTVAGFLSIGIFVILVVRAVYRAVYRITMPPTCYICGEDRECALDKYTRYCSSLDGCYRAWSVHYHMDCIHKVLCNPDEYTDTQVDRAIVITNQLRNKAKRNRKYKGKQVSEATKLCDWLDDIRK